MSICIEKIIRERERERERERDERRIIVVDKRPWIDYK
jgi:hypothetical protein